MYLNEAQTGGRVRKLGQRPTRPAETPWRAQPPTLSNPPVTQVSASGCTNAAQRPLQPPGAQERSEPFALDSACGAAALASIEAATATPQPTVSTSGSWPSAPRPGAPSATKNRPERRCRQVACEPCPRCLFSPVARWSQAPFRAPRARRVSVSQPPWTSGGSSPQAARDAGCVTNWRGVAARQGRPTATG